MFGSASADLMMSRALFTAAHQQDGYPGATETRCSLSTISKSAYLTEESIPGLLDDETTKTSTTAVRVL
jgi:uncharacterized protein YbaR (Trm112 family)